VTHRRRHRKSSILSVDRHFFKTFHGQRYVLRYRCSPDLRGEGRSLASKKANKP
jgi:hypothetical protein